MQEELFEWIIYSGKQEYCLTENQYKSLIANQNNRFVLFDNFTINPAYVTSAYKQKAKKLKKIYPCGECKTNGSNTINGQYEKCKNCNGNGVDLKIKPIWISQLQLNS